MLDLGSLDTRAASEEGAVMAVVHPVTGQPLTQEDGAAVTITLAGMDGDRFRKAQRAATDRRLKSPRRANVTAEDIERDGIETLAACTLAWTGLVLDGETLDCTVPNARKAYQRLPWLREQVDAFIGDRANFLKVSPSN